MAKETLWINDIGSLSFIYLQNNLVGETRAERIRAQIDADEANLRSRDYVYLVPYEKGTQASNDRKKKAP